MSRPASIFAALFALLICAVPAGAFAAPQIRQETIDLELRVFAGGFRALDVSITIALTPDSYRTTLDAKPIGVLGYVLPWGGAYDSRGRIVGPDNRLVPQRYTSISRWREADDRYEMDFDVNGLLTRQVKIETENGISRSKALTRDPSFYTGAVDLVSAITSVMIQSGPKNDCSAAPEIYDGKRRYRFVFDDKGTETLAPSKLNMFAGKARVCTLEMVPLKGYGKEPKGYYKIQEEARKRGDLPRIWMAPLWEGSPMIPVRMLVKSEYGAVLIHLQKATRR